MNPRVSLAEIAGRCPNPVDGGPLIGVICGFPEPCEGALLAEIEFCKRFIAEVQRLGATAGDATSVEAARAYAVHYAQRLADADTALFDLRRR